MSSIIRIVRKIVLNIETHFYAWILATGFWANTGIWDDSSDWID